MTLNDSSKNNLGDYYESEYFEHFRFFQTEADMITNLNEQLPKSIKKIFSQKKEKIQKKIASKKETKEQIDAFFEKVRAFLETDPQPHRMEFRIDDEAEELLFDFLKAISYENSFNNFIRNMSLAYLVTELESYLKGVLKTSFEKKPMLLATCKKSINYEELTKYSSIEDVREDIIEKEIYAILYRDIEEISRYFEQKFNIKLSELTDWETFKEVFYRRNIIVHNSGIVNNIYRLKTGYKAKKKSLEVSYSYLNKSIQVFDEFAQNLAEQLYQKFGK